MNNEKPDYAEMLFQALKPSNTIERIENLLRLDKKIQAGEIEVEGLGVYDED